MPYRDPERRAESKDRSQYKRLYGIGLEEVDTMVLVRGGTCDICGKTSLGKVAHSVDHDYTTGEIRGLLCRSCNGLVGMYEKLHADPTIEERIASYLQG